MCKHVLNLLLSIRVANSCVLFLLFVVETTAENGIIRDFNHSPALAQFYHDKIALHVGGLTDYKTWDLQQNPDWENRVEKFDFERVLDTLNKVTVHLS